MIISRNIADFVTFLVDGSSVKSTATNPILNKFFNILPIISDTIPFIGLQTHIQTFTNKFFRQLILIFLFNP